jgi:MurNAc alpha-1-phosphate uridylyltransferase
MHAMILAAGRGERMRPLTDTLPKPLLPVGGKPLIVWHLEKLARAGIREVVINHAWLGNLIESALGTGAQFGLNIRYSAETSALETAGGIATALPMLGSDPFLVINGDIWCDWDVNEALVIAKNLTTQAQHAWLLLVPNPAHHPEGDFDLSQSGEVGTGALNRYTFSGIGIYAPALFSQTLVGQPAKLAPLLREAMSNRAVSGTLYTGAWVDVGTPQRLEELDQRIRSI